MDRNFVRNLIRTLADENLDAVQQRSLKNFQVPGFTSIVLHRSPELNLRLYVSLPGQSRLNRSGIPTDNTLWIHDHRFDFTCQTIAGYMKNLRFRAGSAHVAPWGIPWGTWHRYIYESALMNSDGVMTLTPDGGDQLWLVKTEKVDVGESYSMGHQELHRILIPNDRFTALLFWEFRRVQKPSRLWSNKQLPVHPDVSNLYAQPSKDELEGMIEAVLREI